MQYLLGGLSNLTRSSEVHMLNHIPYNIVLRLPPVGCGIITTKISACTLRTQIGYVGSLSWERKLTLPLIYPIVYRTAYLTISCMACLH